LILKNAIDLSAIASEKTAETDVPITVPAFFSKLKWVSKKTSHDEYWQIGHRFTNLE
jgi:hypothetical protein